VTNLKHRVSYELTREWWVESFRAWPSVGYRRWSIKDTVCYIKTSWCL